MLTYLCYPFWGTIKLAISKLNWRVLCLVSLNDLNLWTLIHFKLYENQHTVKANFYFYFLSCNFFLFMGSGKQNTNLHPTFPNYCHAAAAANSRWSTVIFASYDYFWRKLHCGGSTGRGFFFFFLVSHILMMPESSLWLWASVAKRENPRNTSWR